MKCPACDHDDTRTEKFLNEQTSRLTRQLMAYKQSLTLRDHFAMAIIAGFAGNNAIFAANGMSGWGLVNCETDQLCATAYGMADAMVEARKLTQE